MGLGAVTVADMDHVQRSNLSRQFLFGAQDVEVSAGPARHPPVPHCPPPCTPPRPLLSSQRLKAEVAAEAARRLNPDLRVTPLPLPLEPATEHVFGDGFFSRVDGVAAALDSFGARECLASRNSASPSPWPPGPLTL